MRQIAPTVLLVLGLTACGSTGVSVAPTQIAAATATITPTQPPAATATSSPTPLPSATPTATQTATIAPTETEVPVTPTNQPDDPGQAPQPTLPARPLPTRVPAPEAAPPITGEAPSDLRDQIIADVIQRSGAERSAIVMVREEAVVWPDGSLGCPEPGMAYLQVLIEGYWIVAQVGDVSYDYRVDSSGRFRLCEMP